MAVTPWPPAAHMEIRPRPCPFCSNNFANVAIILGPVAAKGCPVATLEPFTFNFVTINTAQSAIQSKFVFAERLVFPCFHCAQCLSGKGFVKFVEVKVLQAQASALEHPRHGVGGGHQQAFTVFALRVEVYRRYFAKGQVSHNRQLCSAAQSSLANKTEAAPSVKVVELAAVRVPFSRSKAGFNLASFSSGVSRIMPSRSTPLKGLSQIIKEAFIVGGE